MGRVVWMFMVAVCTSACTPSDTALDDTSGDPVETDAVDTDPPWQDAEPEVVPGVPSLWSHPHGLYDAPFELTLTPPFPEAEVRYTLDGRDPLGEAGSVYAAPISVQTTTVVRAVAIADQQVVVPEQARTFLFVADVVHQQRPEAWPTTWWGNFEGGPYPADHEMDPDVFDAPAYADAFPAAFEDAPILSVVLPPDDLFGETGIHENPTEQGFDWERVASLEIFDAEGLLDANVTCGIRVQGGAGRKPEYSPKKAFRLAFRGRYGTPKLQADLFPDAGYDRFDTLVLRAGYNRSWVHRLAIQRNRAQYLRERFVADVYRDMGHPASRVRLAHLFLNGIYWGVYQLEERPDSAWQSEHWGGVEDDYDAINAGEVSAGDDVAWNALFEAARGGIESPEGFAALEEILDVDAFIDYILLETALGNLDWPHKNYWAGRRREDGARWTFFVWDSELTMPSNRTSFVDVYAEGSPGEIFQLARGNPEFVVRFGDAVHRELSGDGLLTTESLTARWEELSPSAYPAIVAESARWGDHLRDERGVLDAELYTYDDHWLVENARVRDEFFRIRPDWVLEDYRANGLYPAVDAPDLAPLGGEIDAGTEIELSAPAGTVYYTLDGSDPRLVGGGLSDAALSLDDGVPMVVEDVVVSSRVLHEGTWSALVRASFVVR